MTQEQVSPSILAEAGSQEIVGNENPMDHSPIPSTSWGNPTSVSAKKLRISPKKSIKSPKKMSENEKQSSKSLKKSNETDATGGRRRHKLFDVRNDFLEEFVDDEEERKERLKEFRSQRKGKILSFHFQFL